MLVLVALVIAGVVWLVLRLLGHRDRSRTQDAATGGALEILERRFAAGEIDVEEYRERRSTLDRGG
jgi:uncharacterized membrane protein